MSRSVPLSVGTLHERHYELLVQAVVDYAIFMLDLDGHIISWNTGAERIKGYAATEAIGQHLSIFYSEEDLRQRKPWMLLEKALRDGRSQDEGWRLRKDGSRFWALVVLDVIHDAEGQVIGLAKITRDITERHEADLRYDALRAQLFQAQKLEALGQLTGGMAHDFNNLLTIILSAAKLAERTRDPQRLADLLDSIRDAGERGAQMTQHLLTFARRERLPSQRIDLNRLLPEARMFLVQALPRAMSLEMELAPALHPLDVDPSQLEMAMLNLLLNARDAMQDSGVVHLRAQNRLMSGEWDDLHGECVLISVSDHGPGIDPAIQGRLFEPFFTTKEVGKGTGLGLSQVYGFVRQAQGGVHVESVLGQGTTVTLCLPAAERGQTSDCT
ncbi:two-component system sensor histidine kinase NtrB [Phytopseudomonas dryadis]|uniref:histidine kinase n=1 Tax=Phytopseudomonas dryadis TaxID=2487520 RepID=A0A4Q9QVU2_9GAMM|nr:MULTISPECIES: PAS domain-containing hybrid sensor histidine kinase/response regulator [Pseudomonas]TBU88146.1 PAS domain-containing sensor histidine kinase [Pseudomonas dryadis]TBV05405.1 PAS domain-containing sensor histidine kinase [Pseudomonas dryadis]TBV18414.1 PAS domain-containing sensor histidine kinase [Pseudomonas sp. FRB 230]